MPYGTIKVDNIIFTNGGSDQTVTVSGIVASTSGNLTVTGTISGGTVKGTYGSFTSLTGVTTSGTNANFQTITGAVGVYTTSISGLAITGNTAGFTTVTGTTVTGTTANFVTLSGTTITGGTINVTTTNITSGIFAAGSAAAPSIAFTGDTDTGIYSPGANQVAISTNGTGRLQIDSSGNVGIGAAPVVTFAGQTHLTVNHSAGGTSVAGYNLAVNGTRYASFISYPSNSEALRITAESATLPITFHTNSSERMRLDSSGQLGIGTSAPGARLSVDSAATGIMADFNSTNANGGYISFLSSSSVYGDIGTAAQCVGGSASDFSVNARGARALVLGTNNSTRLFINSSGNVGIGTTSPQANLHIQAVTGASLRIQAGSTSSAQIDLIPGGAVDPYYIYVNSSRNLIFQDNASERARIDSSGRFLVGTSTSTTVSSVGYTANIQVANSGNAGLSLHGYYNASIYGADLIFTKSRSNTIGTNTILQNGDDFGTIFFAGANGTGYDLGASISGQVDGVPGASSDMPGRLVFSTTADGSVTPTERLRITSAGLVGIGTSTPIAPLDCVTGSSGAIFRYDSASTYFSILPGDANGAVVLKASANSGAAPNLQFQNDAGQTRMTITDAGNVGIGTTSPGTTLAVNGNIGSTGRGNSFGYTLPDWRIYNSSSGGALVIDNYTTEALRVDSSNRLLVGTSSASSSVNQVEVATTSSGVGFSTFSASESALRSSYSAYAGLQLAAYQADSGAPYTKNVDIVANSDGTVPSQMRFLTKASGAASPTEQLRITSAGVLQVADAGNITVGTTTGTKIGTATTQKLGFYNATPVVQPTAVADATTAIDVITQLNALLAKLRTLGIIAT